MIQNNIIQKRPKLFVFCAKEKMAKFPRHTCVITMHVLYIVGLKLVVFTVGTKDDIVIMDFFSVFGSFSAGIFSG